MNIRRLGLIFTAIVTLLAFVPVPLVLAQDPADQGQALEIAPPVITLSADPGETLKTNINLRDISNGPLIVTNEINDFIADQNKMDGTPITLFDEETPGPYSLRNWITPLPQLLLQPKEVRQIPVTIVVPEDASPGAHYGVIRFTGIPPDLDSTGVSLSASLGALIFLKINGDAKEDLSLTSFTATHNGKPGPVFESTPLEFSQQIKNAGNTIESPTGNITIKNMFGKPIAAINVNLAKNRILPDSSRKFTASLNESVIGKKMLFGRYTAQIRLTYGTKNQTLTGNMSFWVIPYKLIAVIIFLLIGGFFLLRHLIGGYNRRIINQAQKSKSKSKSKK